MRERDGKDSADALIFSVFTTAHSELEVLVLGKNQELSSSGKSFL